MSHCGWPGSTIVTLALLLAIAVPSDATLLATPQAPSNSAIPAQAISPAAQATSISAGGDHTCLLTASGGVKCWGDNIGGQLGDGTRLQRGAPVDVSGLASGVVAIAAGGDHTCALTSTGGVKCWGANYYGEVGDGSWTRRTTPVDVSGLTSGVAAITAVGEWVRARTCALTTAGGVKCWGFPPLGDGTANMSNAPVNVSGLSSGIVDIAAAHNWTCALTAGGGVKCWGENLIGVSPPPLIVTPVDMPGLTSGIMALSAGYWHMCGLTSAGGVKCWGSNNSGQLGDGTTTAHNEPVDVVGLGGRVSEVVAGGDHTCALLATGTVNCWGRNNSGQLGDGTMIDRLKPTEPTGLPRGVVALAAGIEHTCALFNDGSLRCWGHDNGGQLGAGTITQRSVPREVAGLTTGVTQVAAGGRSSCALTSAGGVKCWGEGPLGNGLSSGSSLPVNVSGLTSGVQAVAVGIWYGCALTSAGGVKCWGDNRSGQLGDGSTTQSLFPVSVVGLTSGVKALTVGTFGHVCALTDAGAAKCWGGNSDGQLGNGTTTSSPVPVNVTGLASSVVGISAGAQHTCAVTGAGSVKCWGLNSSGQLGDGTVSITPPYGKSLPVDVAGIGGATAVGAGAGFSCAKVGSGVKCWGSNASGQLGNESTANSPLPVDVSGLTSGVDAIATGHDHTCALTGTGGLKCWGLNVYGQLGELTFDPRLAPTDVAGLRSGVAAVSAGYYHSCALTTAGGVQCWGWDGYGQLGLGTQVVRLLPVGVVGFGGAQYAISGQVTDTGGQPMAGVVVSAGPTGIVVTDGGGNYILYLPPDLASGTYSLSAQFPGYTFSAPRTVTVPPSATGQDFTGTAGGTDVTPPTGSLLTPAAGEKITPVGLDLTATAQDNAQGSGVERVEFYGRWNGRWHLLGTDTTSPYRLTWLPPMEIQTQTVAFSLFVYDKAGNVARDAGGLRQAGFWRGDEKLIANRAYLNQRALGENGDVMCSMASIAMVMASAGLIGSDFDSLRTAANEAWDSGLRAPGAQAVSNYLNTPDVGLTASVTWTQDRQRQWELIKAEIEAGRPLILSVPPNGATDCPAVGGRLTSCGHYVVVTGYSDAPDPAGRLIIAYDPFGRWLGRVNAYDQNSPSPEEPGGVKGRSVYYPFNSLGTTYLVTARRTTVPTGLALEALPDEVFVLDTQDIVDYTGHGETQLPIPLYLPLVTR